MGNIIELSHQITSEDSCSFSVTDSRPQLFFQEGESHGMRFITSYVDNLHSNTGTHIDFPGHLPHLNSKHLKPVGAYSLERFVGNVLVINVSQKTDVVNSYFNDSGYLLVDSQNEDNFLAFLNELKNLKIEKSDIEKHLDRNVCERDELIGIIFYSGLSRFWQHRKFEAWKYQYFFNPFLSEEASQFIVELGLSFIGIDALQIEDPIINFNGHELPLVINNKCRTFYNHAIKHLVTFSNHHALLSNDILMYENLNIPKEIVGQVGLFSGAPLNFHLNDFNDNALVRPYIILK